jgi:DNA-binding NarL/FixJ family response regulator
MQSASTTQMISATQVSQSADVVIVEDHELLAQSLGFALSAEGIRVRVPQLHDPGQLLADIVCLRPRLVLLDLDLGGAVGDGVALIRPLVELGVDVLVVSGVTDHVRIATAIEAGAIGHLSKSHAFDDLLVRVRRAVNGEALLTLAERQDLLAVLRRQRADEATRLAPFQRLTPRERAVLTALRDGRSVETIAQEWFVSEATVRTQVRGILTKLDVCSQLAAVAKAREAGWDPGHPDHAVLARLADRP